LNDADVRNILAVEQKKVLAGCKIVFSRIFPVGEQNPHMHPFWQMAEQFGAICTNQLGDSVTHVVAHSLGTDKVDKNMYPFHINYMYSIQMWNDDF
jgi:RNA polymerase II C-terminal domain phosphatase-like 3/4